MPLVSELLPVYNPIHLQKTVSSLAGHANKVMTLTIKKAFQTLQVRVVGVELVTLEITQNPAIKFSDPFLAGEVDRKAMIFIHNGSVSFIDDLFR